MQSFRFELYGEVKGKPRPRFARTGGHVRTYTPRSGSIYEAKVAEAYKACGGTVVDGPVCVIVKVFRPLPKSKPKKVTEEWDRYKPDIDNILKIVMDGLNGVAYKDDKDVAMVIAAKVPRRRGQKEHIEVTVFDARETEGDSIWKG